MKLDRLKEIAVDDDVLRFPSRHLPEYGEVMKALPGLLRVCDAYRELLVSYAELNASRFGMTIDVDGPTVRRGATKKLEELL